MFKLLAQNESRLAESMKREMITDYLRRHNYLTADQYQHILNTQYHYKANQYLLQLVRSEDKKYLSGLKGALRAAGQDELIQYLP